jgi:hypothetical protein
MERPERGIVINSQFAHTESRMQEAGVCDGKKILVAVFYHA